MNKTHNNICNLAFLFFSSLFPRFKTTICGSGFAQQKKTKKRKRTNARHGRRENNMEE
jgi:hypothetical protein